MELCTRSSTSGSSLPPAGPAPCGPPPAEDSARPRPDSCRRGRLPGSRQPDVESGQPHTDERRSDEQLDEGEATHSGEPSKPRLPHGGLHVLGPRRVKTSTVRCILRSPELVTGRYVTRTCTSLHERGVAGQPATPVAMSVMVVVRIYDGPLTGLPWQAVPPAQ